MSKYTDPVLGGSRNSPPLAQKAKQVDAKKQGNQSYLGEYGRAEDLRQGFCNLDMPAPTVNSPDGPNRG